MNLITKQLSEIIQELPIKTLNKQRHGGFIFAPNYYFDEPTPAQRNIQLNLKNQYDKIFELLRLIFKNAPTDIIYKLDEVDKLYRMWLQLESNWAIKPNPEHNVHELLDHAAKFNPILEILDAGKNKNPIIIPDTNSLLLSCNPLVYKKSLNINSFTILLLPTVLNELDKLKILHRNQDVREKAQKIINRIKGWRTQGSLIDGITVEKSIIIQTIPTEPNMINTLSWLDKDVNDDRIIASVMEIQSKYPATTVILYTSDINLQNKAEAAIIEYRELQKT